MTKHGYRPTIMMKHISILVLALFMCTLSKGQTSGFHEHNRLSACEIAIPVAIVGVASAFSWNGWMSDRKWKLQDALPSGHQVEKLDDWLQYSPAALSLSLDLFGVKGKHRYGEKVILLAMSWATMGIAVNAMKYSFRERRPDSNAMNSFPSGHTATAFMAAECLRKEFKDVSPWIGIAGYTAATVTGCLRVYHNRHFVNDVVAGAAIGILSAKAAYWLYPKIFRNSTCRGNSRISVTGAPYFSSDHSGLNLCLTF